MFAALADLDWRSQEFYTYLAVAGAVVIALSVALYAVPGSKVKVPGIIVGIVGIGLGVAGGVILMAMIGYDTKKMEELGGPPPEGSAGGPPGGGRGGMPGGGMGGMGGMGGGMPGGGRGGPGGGRGGPGGGGPNYRAQLALLVGKLDVLTDKPLTVQLSDDQRKKVKEVLKGLDADELSDEDAEKKAKDLHDLLTDQKETLKAAGYSWPGEGGRGGPGGGRGGPGGPSNPFKTEQNAQHLKSLEERLDKKG